MITWYKTGTQRLRNRGSKYLHSKANMVSIYTWNLYISLISWNIVDGTITEKNNSSSLYAEESVAFTRDVKQRKQKVNKTIVTYWLLADWAELAELVE